MIKLKSVTKAERDFSIPITTFFVLLAMPFLNISAVLTFAAVLGVVIILYKLITMQYHVDLYMLVVGILFIVGESFALFKCPDLNRTWHYSIEKALVVLVLYPIMAGEIKTYKQIKSACNLFKIGCFISAGLVWLSLFSNIHFDFILAGYQTQRLIFANFGPNVAARMFCVGALIALYNAQVEEKRVRVINYLEFIIIGYAVIATISVSGIIILTFGTIIILAIYNQGVRKFGIIKYFAVLIIIIVLCLFAYNNIQIVTSAIEKYRYRMIMNQNDISNGRLAGLKGLSTYLSKYWLFGIGYACSNYVVGMTIHFPIIASLIEVGIFGFASVLYQYGAVMHSDIVSIITLKKYTFYSFLSVVILLGDMIQPNPNYLFTWFAIYLGICNRRIMMEESHEIF